MSDIRPVSSIDAFTRTFMSYIHRTARVQHRLDFRVTIGLGYDHTVPIDILT
jgi:hypothetical protein